MKAKKPKQSQTGRGSLSIRAQNQRAINGKNIQAEQVTTYLNRARREEKAFKANAPSFNARLAEMFKAVAKLTRKQAQRLKVMLGQRKEGKVFTPMGTVEVRDEKNGGFKKVRAPRNYRRR